MKNEIKVTNKEMNKHGCKTAETEKMGTFKKIAPRII